MRTNTTVGLILCTLLFMGCKLAAVQNERYVGKYTRVKWMEGPNDWGNVVLDPQFRYLAKINAIGLYIWNFSPDFASGDLVYDNVKKHEYEVERGLAAATRDGLAFVAAYAHPAPNEPTIRLLLWNADTKSIKELQRRNEISSHIITNPDGTKLVRLIARMQNEFFENETYHPPKIGESLYEVRDLISGQIEAISAGKDKVKSIAYPVALDTRANIYDVVQLTGEARDIEHSAIGLRFVQANGSNRIVLNRQNEPLLTHWRGMGCLKNQFRCYYMTA